MIRFTLGLTLVASVLLGGIARAEHTKSVPIVTQVQGATFYRTSLTISNGDALLTTPVNMKFSYRAPDGTFQIAQLALAPNLGPRRVQVFDDIVQEFKDSGAIRAQDTDDPLFGTLLVSFATITDDTKFEAAAVARTYSPGPAGGTLGIAYAGRCFCLTGSTGRVIGAMRSGIFGNDGSTRANLGIINEGFGATDVQVSYFDGDTGNQLKTFALSTRAGHVLEENEVFQINNIFGDPAIPVGTTKLVVELRALTNGVYVSGYGVQLDNTTNDGAFFFFEEE
ncbi:MAG TPA: hypothetical protein VGH97_16380 [Thermoanaerobaculia bacterium]|jgi:hypothetical protein